MWPSEEKLQAIKSFFYYKGVHHPSFVHFVDKKAHLGLENTYTEERQLFSTWKRMARIETSFYECEKDGKSVKFIWLCPPQGVFENDDSLEDCLSTYGTTVDVVRTPKTYEVRETFSLLDMSQRNTLNYVEECLREQNIPPTLFKRLFYYDEADGVVKRESVFEDDKTLVCQLVNAVPNFKGWIHPKLPRSTNGDFQQREALVVDFERFLETIAPNSYEAIKHTLDENASNRNVTDQRRTSDYMESPMPPPIAKKTRRIQL